MRFSSRLTRDEAAVRISVAVGFFVVTAIVFFPFLTTHYVTQDDSQAALAGWRDVPALAWYAAWISGRFYFLVGAWFGWIPYAFDSFAYFKTMQMLGLMGNFVGLYYLAWKTSASRPFALLAVLIALVTTQARWEHNLVAAFPWAFTTSLTLMMIGIGLFVDHLEKPRRWKQLLSACLFFLSLFTYESFLLYSVVFPLLAWRFRPEGGRGLWWTVRSIWAHAALGLLYALAYLGFRLVFPTTFGDYQIQFSASAMLKAWATYGGSALPAAAYADLGGLINEFSDAYTGFDGGPLAVFRQIRVEWVILCVVVAALCAWIMARIASSGQGSRLAPSWIVASVMAVVPHIPHAMTPRYQSWVALGVKSYVPTYMVGFGIALLLACGATAVARLVRGAWTWTWCTAAALAYVALLTAFSNFYVARSQTIARRKWDLVDAILRSEQFRNLPDNAVVLAPTWWHGINIMQVLDDYWTRYVYKKTGRHVRVVRTFAEFQAACPAGCGGRAFFSKYAREHETANQFMVLAPMQGDPAQGLSARSIDVFVLSASRWFSAFVGLQGEASSTVSVDGAPVTDSARGSLWIRMDRRAEHRAPFSFRISSQPEGLDPDSVMLSDYTEGDRFSDSVQTIFADGFFGEERAGDQSWNWGAGRATLILRNQTSSPQDVVLSFRIQGSIPSCHVAINQPGVSPFTRLLLPAEHRIRARLGGWQDMRIEFDSDCPQAPGDPRDLRFNLRSVRLREGRTVPPGADRP